MKSGIQFFFLLSALLLSTSALSAQDYLIEDNKDNSPRLYSASEFPLYADQDPRVYYIDFETISSKIEEVAIVDQGGETLWTANVFGLPSDAIYELSLHNLSPGQYQVELRMFHKVMKHDLTL